MAVLPFSHETSNASPNLIGYAADSAKSFKLPVHMPSGVVFPNLRWGTLHLHLAFKALIPGQVVNHL